MADMSWSEAMSLALDDPDALAEVRGRLQDLHAGTSDARLLDVCSAALDLLRRWSQAATVDYDQADILLNDYRPVRPYAIRLGGYLDEHQAAAVIAGKGG